MANTDQSHVTGHSLLLTLSTTNWAHPTLRLAPHSFNKRSPKALPSATFRGHRLHRHTTCPHRANSGAEIKL